MRVAMATYQRGEHDIAKDIFVLAMQDESAKTLLGPSLADKASLRAAAEAAIASHQYAKAIKHLQAIQAMDEPIDEPEEDELEEEEEEEASMSPGDVVETVPVPELAPAQVASIVALTRQIKAGGHEDLAAKITKALGL